MSSKKSLSRSAMRLRLFYGVLMKKTNFYVPFLISRTNQDRLLRLAAEERLNRYRVVSAPADFNEGASNNTYSRNEKMVGYSFEHGFNDTFAVRQNLRFVEMRENRAKSVIAQGIAADGHTATAVLSR